MYADRMIANKSNVVNLVKAKDRLIEKQLANCFKEIQKVMALQKKKLHSSDDIIRVSF